MSRSEQPRRSSPSPTMRKALLALIPNLRAFAVSLSGDADQADDLVQETLLKAWDRFESFQEGTNLLAWLFTILRNTYFDERRRRRVLEDPGGEKTDALCVHPAQHGHMDMQDFRRALGAVPAEQREALILVTAAGLSYDEAAAIAGCATGTIKSRVHRARNRHWHLSAVIRVALLRVSPVGSRSREGADAEFRSRMNPGNSALICSFAAAVSF